MAVSDKVGQMLEFISLTDTKNQVKIWSEKFDKEFNAENFFNLQDEIVENVIDSLIGNGAVLAQEVAKIFQKLELKI